MKTLKLIQVGMGVRGAQWARVIREDARTENVAYVRQHLAFVQKTLQEWGEPNVPCFATLEEALAKVEADAVVLVTPPEVHYQQVSAAF
jgi:predicted dehydrogenase